MSHIKKSTIAGVVNRRTSTAWMGAALAACVDLRPLHKAGSVLSTTREQRFTDEAIARDHAAIDALRARVAALRSLHAAPGAATASSTNPYAIARAEAQIDFALEEYEENDTTGLVEGLLDDALRIVAAMEAGAQAPLALPALPGTTRQRAHLWQRVEQAKSNPTLLACAGQPLARLELALLELGHEQWEADTGLNEADHAKPYEALVDALAAEFELAASRCAPVAVRAAEPQPAPPAPVLARQVSTATVAPTAAVAKVLPAPPLPPLPPLRLQALALFRFDEWAVHRVLPEGRAQVDAYAQLLKARLPDWRRLLITGHTDRLGRHDYNLRLSHRRAQTVCDLLVQLHGLPTERMQVQGLGATRPLAHCHGPNNAALRACLQANRRVELEVLL